jgi:hypothetical protein
VGFVVYDPWVEANRARLAELHREAAIRQPSDAGVTVVALGDSKLRYATMDEAALTEMAARRGIHAPHFLRLDRDNATFDDFASLADDILAARPDLIVLQLDLLAREPALLHDFWIYLYTGLRSLLRGRPFEEASAVGCSDKQDPDWNAGDAVWRGMLANHRNAFRVDMASPAYERVRDFVGRAKRLGVGVVLLGVPATARAENHFYGSGNRFYPGTMARVRADALLEVWQYPDRLSDQQHYCDFTHLNERGRTLFSRWLLARLVDRLAPEPTGAPPRHAEPSA